MMLDVLIQFAKSWWPLYAVHMLETSAFILLVWAVDRWVTLDTRLRYSLWLCALVKAFVPPFYALPLPAFLFEEPLPVAPVVSAPMPHWEPVPFELAPVVLPPEPIPVAFWVFVLWGFSVLGFVGLTLWRNRAFQRALGIANPVVLSADLSDLTQGADLKVYSKANLNSPLLVGVVKPRLYLPSSWQTWTSTQLRGVVAHELAHYHNRDLWALAFQVLATVLFGLNPLSWLVNRRLAHLRELRCDEDALRKSGISPVEYSKLLYAFLDAKAHPGLPALGFTEKDTPLKKRFEHVLNFKGGTMKRKKWQLAVPILMALAIVPFSIRETYSQPQAVLPQPDINSEQRLSVSIEIPERLFEPEGIPSAWNVDQEPRALNQHVAVTYPQDAILAGLQDIVFVKYRVDAQGHPSHFEVMKGNEIFHHAAIEAVKQLRYEPAKLNGEAVEVGVVQHVKFKMGNPPMASVPGLGEVPPPKTQGMDDARIKPTKQIPPIYPEDLRLNGVEGYVLMDVTINANGRVDDVMLAEGNKGFADAARTALLQYRYTPFNHASSMKRTEAMVFKLSGDNRPEYQPPKGKINPSDFKYYLTVVAKAPDVAGQSDGAAVLYASVDPEGYVRLNDAKGYHNSELLVALEEQKNKGAKEIRISRNGIPPQGAVNKLEEYARQVGLQASMEEPVIPFYKVQKKPKIRNTIKPVYPPNGQGKKDKVFVKFLINADGSVSHVSVLRGDQVFHQAAIDAVKQLQYQPAEHQGKAVPVWMTRPITFDPKATANAPLKDQRQIYASHEVDVKPHPIDMPTPKYPSEAKAQELSGEVFVTGVVNKDGTVSDIRILRGDKAFYEAALNTVKNMTFRPGKHQGEIVPVRMIFPIDFGMKKRGSVPSSLEAKLADMDKAEDIAHIWINTKGQVLVDFSKPVSLESLGDELIRLKQEKNIQIIRVQPDEDTPMGFVQKALDAVGKAGLKSEIFKRGGQIKKEHKPLDLNNLEFFQVDSKPTPVRQVAPVYPEIADRIGLTGKVFLKFRVHEDGTVGEVDVLRGQQIFRNAAIEAIEKFRYRPAEHEGKPVSVWMTQPISFRHGRGPLVEQQVDLDAFTTGVPNGQGEMGRAHAQFTLTVISKGAAEVIAENQQKAQQAARAYVSQIPLNQWATEAQQQAIMDGVREQLNSAFGVPLVKGVAISKLLVNPTQHIAQNHAFKLHSNFPNPFNPQTSIKYEVAEPIFVRMEIYNVTGQVIRTLVAKDHTPGQFETRWDGTNDQGTPVASGVYYYHITAGSFNAVKKMQLVK